MATTTSKPGQGSIIKDQLTSPAAARWLALGALIGPLLFALAWIVLGILQPAIHTEYGVMGGISGAISNPISGIGVGPNAHLFNAAFVLCGVIILAGVVGVFQTIRGIGPATARRVCAALLAVSPVGLALAGIFTLESSVVLHNVAALLLFGVPVLGFLATGLYFRRIPRWRRFGSWLIVGSPLTLILLVVFARTFDVAAVAAGVGVAGLTERVLLLEIHAWYAAMGWFALQRS